MTLASCLQVLANQLWIVLNMVGEALCHPIVLAGQILGCIVLILLGAGWLLGFFKRRNRLESFGIKNPQLLDTETKVRQIPCVSVILPVKGIRQHSISNWLAQMASKYKGGLEYVFVVESAQDQAIPGLRSVINQLPQVLAKIEVAGCATTSSQKIHNMLHGLSATCSLSKYVLFLDDDVALHEESIGNMVKKIESNPNIFLVTGYPFDIPPEDASIQSFCMMAFHLPLMIPFCIDFTCFVWGGCMLLRREHLLKGDPYGILDAWKDGGYSDDMLMGAKCIEHKLMIAAAPAAVFPQRLETKYSWAQLWNYIKRQLFVMDTYSTDSNRRVNHAMLTFHVLVSFSLIMAIIAGCLRIILWLVDLLLLLTRRVFSSEDASVDWVKLFEISGCSKSTIVTTLCFFIFLFAHTSLMSVIGELMQQFHKFFPGYVTLRTDALFFCRVWAGVFVTNAIIPFCALHTLLSPSVVWSGIQYTRKRGRIVDMKRITT